jgi:endonuclease/exonuclease/phosphatase family metal-dependent hydrolase
LPGFAAKKAGMAAVLAVLAAGVGVPTTATAVTAPTTLKVASFNVMSVAAKPYGSLKPWKDRRAAVVSTIMSNKPDVLGVQEATASLYYKPQLVSGDHQFLDLRNGLVSAGGNYKLTNSYAFNCVDHNTDYKCVKQYRGASGGQRILYNADRIELVSQGSVDYTSQQSPTEKPRGVAYAVLKHKSNGAKFFVANTHLANEPESVLLAQWKQLISTVKSKAGTLPVVILGDFNTSKWNAAAGEMLPAMRTAGFGDVLNSTYNVLRPNPVRALSIAQNGWINSFNKGSRDVKTFSYWDKKDVPGKGIDWVFASNSLGAPFRPITTWSEPTSPCPASEPANSDIRRVSPSPSRAPGAVRH